MIGCMHPFAYGVGDAAYLYSRWHGHTREEKGLVVHSKHYSTLAGVQVTAQRRECGEHMQ